MLIAIAILIAVVQASGTQQATGTNSVGSEPAAPPKTFVAGKIAWDHYLRIKGDVKPPQPLLSTTPSSTNVKSGKKGTVTLLIAISEIGNVDGAKILRSLRPDLDRKALEIVSTWQFAPATKQLVPVPVQMNAEVNFFVQ